METTLHMFVAGIWAPRAQAMLNITIQAESQEAAERVARAQVRPEEGETLDWVEQID